MQEGDSEARGFDPWSAGFLLPWARRKMSLNFLGKVKRQEICLYRSRVRSGVTPIAPLKDQAVTQTRATTAASRTWA